ncbi:MAG TPA: alpha/beta hydrolase [Chitinophagaceae bacterium]
MKKQINFVIVTVIFIILLACNNNSKENEITPTQSTAPVIKSVFVNGDSLHYIETGKGEPVIFVHGTLDDYRLWYMQMDTFAKDHRAIAYSRRYAYPNKRVINDSADYSPVIHARDLTEFIKALNIGPVHLVGHSYGAFTALLTTMDHPELVKTLMLGEPPAIPLLQNVPGADTLVNNFMNRSIKPAADAFRSGDNVKAVSIFMAAVTGDTSLYASMPKEIKDQMMENILELRGVSLAKNIFPNINCDSIRSIKTPVLIMTGEKTLPLFKAINKELEKCLLNNEKVVLVNASHGLEMENPADFNKIVLAFINKHR